MAEHTNHVRGPRGFTETFDDRTVETLLALGLIAHVETVAHSLAGTVRYYRATEWEDA